jgi:hypothetical protein
MTDGNQTEGTEPKRSRRGGPRKKIRDPECKTMSVPEAGRRYLGIGDSASWEAARRGELPVIRIGRFVRVPIVAMERMMEEARPVARAEVDKVFASELVDER